jgi:2-polyprenyl-3-methyl-5-hydroxy-6-metoxy-1,4-benzoquinol methylase
MELYIDQINEYIKEASEKKNKVNVLEAGCGSASRFDFGANAHITGVDISLGQLNANEMLDEKIHGDIQTIKLEPSSFDIIVCCEVLEHVKKPELALKNFHEFLKEDGIAIIMIPNVWSLKGLLTKYTPLGFHKWVYKNVYKYNKVPFPTYLRFTISPHSLKKFQRNNGFILQWSYYRTNWVEILRKKSLPLYTAYLTFGLLLRIVTFGVISISNTEFVIVCRKLANS